MSGRNDEDLVEGRLRPSCFPFKDRAETRLHLPRRDVEKRGTNSSTESLIVMADGGQLRDMAMILYSHAIDHEKALGICQNSW